MNVFPSQLIIPHKPLPMCVQCEEMLDLVEPPEAHHDPLTRSHTYVFTLSCRHHQQMTQFRIRVKDGSVQSASSHQLAFENILKDLPDQFEPESPRDWLRLHHSRAKKVSFLQDMKNICHSTPITDEDKAAIDELYNAHVRNSQT